MYASQRNASDKKVYVLSSLISSNGELFAELIYKAYILTEHLRFYYPDYFNWYWATEVPRVVNGTGEIIIYMIGNNIAGIASLKKDGIEKKICTFYVAREYRGKVVAKKLLAHAFKYLGTTKPLISMSEHKSKEFEPIIKKYKWKLTQILEGYYSTSREFVYNGTLSD